MLRVQNQRASKKTTTTINSKEPHTAELQFPFNDYPEYNFIGRFLGTSGSNINQIRDELAAQGHHCRVKLESSGPRPHISIGAKTSEGLNRAVAMIQPFLVPHFISGTTFIKNKTTAAEHKNFYTPSDAPSQDGARKKNMENPTQDINDTDNEDLIQHEADECPICLELLSKEAIRGLNCGHEFHASCIDEMTSYHGLKKAICPMCQQNGTGCSPKVSGVGPPTALTISFGSLDDESPENDGEILGSGGGGGRVRTQPASKGGPKSSGLALPSAPRASSAAAAAAASPSPSSQPPQPPAAASALSQQLRKMDGVSEAVVGLLEAHGLFTREAVMKAHDKGLSELGIKKGPRVRVLKAAAASALTGEDPRVMDIMEQFHLGRYRAFLAEEMIDLEALGLYSDESDDVLRQDLGVQAEDMKIFRDATAIAKDS